MSLQGKTVLVTRSIEQANSFSTKIREYGGIPIEIPLLTIQKVSNEEIIREELERLETYDWLVFTSKNGVDIFFDFFQQFKGLSPLPKIAVVGTQTQKALEAKGYSPDIVPNEFVAEALFESLKPFVNKDTRFLLARGNLSRSFLVKELSKLGADVTDLIIYETVENHSQKDRLIHLLKEQEIDILTFTSPSTISHFYNLVEGTEWRKWTENCLFACIGPVSKKRAEQLQMPIHICPQNYTLDDMLNEIIDYINNEQEEQ